MDMRNYAVGVCLASRSSHASKTRRQDELEFLQDLGAWIGSVDMRLSLREMPHLWETTFAVIFLLHHLSGVDDYVSNAWVSPR
ncbi:hypothetical protein BDV38DRAFT_239125 [Aspergillus pseudotamarii]|uniref:Uncharacterized protein n=1 Tax=Aspergillus pseudotamarii TaxID=132259 RepID=A0A5N6T310_ASPPS|nr:uncharacterized protein BDV38DRAFT_239125 [Aspergillus pseudotamarii]KAE8140694.1 hypothetical protein BDV38DRAFT_239125 [Aspergillus pseudotamarii]